MTVFDPITSSRPAPPPYAARLASTRGGFTLIELLVALVVFAAMAAAAYGGLAQIARVRGKLAAEQDRFAAIARTVSLLERDLRQSVARAVLGNNGEPLAAFAGGADGIELTHLGFANPRAEPRSNLERVVYALDDGKLRRGRYAVLDRAPDTAPATKTLAADVSEWHLRFIGCDGAWRDAWPPAEKLGCEDKRTGFAPPETLPYAVEFRIVFKDLGEVRRVVELPSAFAVAAPADSGKPTSSPAGGQIGAGAPAASPPDTNAPASGQGAPRSTP